MSIQSKDVIWIITDVHVPLKQCLSAAISFVAGLQIHAKFGPSASKYNNILIS